MFGRSLPLRKCAHRCQRQLHIASMLEPEATHAMLLHCQTGASAQKPAADAPHTQVQDAYRYDCTEHNAAVRPCHGLCCMHWLTFLRQCSHCRYAVRVGHRPGVYKSWEECHAQVHRFPGAQYKGFASQNEAQDFADVGNVGQQALEFKTPKKTKKKPALKLETFSEYAYGQDQGNFKSGANSTGCDTFDMVRFARMSLRRTASCNCDHRTRCAT